LLIARIAFWRGSLSRSGAIGALIIGTLTFGFGSRMWGFLLVLFFVTSSALSRFREADKHKAAQAFEKGSRRDLGQVATNGGVAAVLVVSPMRPKQKTILLAAGADLLLRKHSRLLFPYSAQNIL
jgi:uncharacterized membrane protein